MTTPAEVTEEKKPVIADFTEYQEKWDYLERMRADAAKLKAGIERAEDFFSEEMARQGAVGFTIGGVDRVTYHRNGTFAARRFQDENPHVAAECMVTQKVFSAERAKHLFPDLYDAYVGHRFVYVQPSKRGGRRK